MGQQLENQHTVDPSMGCLVRRLRMKSGGESTRFTFALRAYQAITEKSQRSQFPGQQFQSYLHPL